MSEQETVKPPVGAPSPGQTVDEAIERARLLSPADLDSMIAEAEVNLLPHRQLLSGLMKLRRAKVAAAASAKARAERTGAEARQILAAREADPGIRGSVVRLSGDFKLSTRTVNNRLRQAKRA
jgi:hypothetical protein